jgi:hypothetical protein
MLEPHDIISGFIRRERKIPASTFALSCHVVPHLVIIQEEGPTRCQHLDIGLPSLWNC